MTDTTSILITFGAAIIGAIIVLGSVFIGAWIMFKGTRQQGSGEGFLKEPKGAVFNIPDGSFPAGPDEPSADEKNLAKQTNRFLEVLGGKG